MVDLDGGTLQNIGYDGSIGIIGVQRSMFGCCTLVYLLFHESGMERSYHYDGNEGNPYFTSFLSTLKHHLLTQSLIFIRIIIGQI